MSAKRIGVVLWLAFAALVAHAQTQTQTPQRDLSQDAYEALAKQTIWVWPSARDKVDVAKVEAAAKKIEPMKLKVIVVPELKGKWKRGSQELRASYGKWLGKERLGLDNYTVIVYTKNGISAYSDKLGDAKLQDLSNQAARLATRNDFTPAIVYLAEHLDTQASRTDAARGVSLGLVIGIPVAILGAVFIGRAAKKKMALKSATDQAMNLRTQALEGISYLDSYADLLPKGNDATAVVQYRQRAFEEYEKGTAILKSAREAREIDGAKHAFGNALSDIEEGKRHIGAITGGTNIAFSIPPRIDDAQSGPPPVVDGAPLYEPVQNVCFFCSRPGHGDLTPVTMNLAGQKRTVMVCPDDLQDLQSGQQPRMRGQYMNGQFTPWYQVPGYDPYVSYGSGNFIWDMLAMNSLMNMFNPFGYGYGFHHHHYWDPGPDYGSGSWSGGGGDGGGFSLNPADQGGNFGGGDFGGDFGDSGDSGGGGFSFGDFFGGGGGSDGGGDFGGGDFGGGDFGGGDGGGGGDF